MNIDVSGPRLITEGLELVSSDDSIDPLAWIRPSGAQGGLKIDAAAGVTGIPFEVLIDSSSILKVDNSGIVNVAPLDFVIDATAFQSGNGDAGGFKVEYDADNYFKVYENRVQARFGNRVVWQHVGGSSFEIDLEDITTTDVDGLLVENGTDYFRVLRHDTNEINLTAVLGYASFVLSESEGFDVSGVANFDSTMAIGGNVTLTGGGSIVSTSDGDISVVPDNTGIFYCGAGSPGKLGTPVSGDAYFQGRVEIDGMLYPDAGINTAGNIIVGTNASVSNSSDILTIMFSNSYQATVNCATFAIGETPRFLLICDYGDRTSDYGHTAQTNPTIYLHSATGAGTATDEWMSFVHDGSEGVIAVGSGQVKFTSPVSCASNLFVANNMGLVFGTNAAAFEYDAVAVQFLLGLNSAHYQFIICDYTLRSNDFDHAAQQDPTLFLHSATDPDTANDQWISFVHNRTDGVIDCGTGTLNLGGTANINLAGASMGSATVTHDDYFEIEIAGATKKVMCGS